MGSNKLAKPVFITTTSELAQLIETIDVYDGKQPDIILAGHEVSPSIFVAGGDNKSLVSGNGNESILQPKRYVNSALGLPVGGFVSNSINGDCAKLLIRHKLTRNVYLAQDAVIQFAAKTLAVDKTKTKALIAIFVAGTGAIHISSLIFAGGKLIHSQANCSNKERVAEDVQWLVVEELRKLHNVSDVCVCSNDCGLSHVSDIDDTTWYGDEPFRKPRRQTLLFATASKTKPYRLLALLASASVFLFIGILYFQWNAFNLAKNEFSTITAGIEDLLDQGAADSISLIKTRQYYIEQQDEHNESANINLLLSAVSTLKRDHPDLEPTLVKLSLAKQRELSFNGRIFDFSLSLDITLKGAQSEKSIIDRILKAIGEHAQARMELVARPRIKSENSVKRLSLQFAGALKKKED